MDGVTCGALGEPGGDVEPDVFAFAELAENKKEPVVPQFGHGRLNPFFKPVEVFLLGFPLVVPGLIQHDLEIRRIGHNGLEDTVGQRGQNREAIEQLDALGELQLDAGLTAEAAKTIKQIISMNPERLEDYQKLLSQLGG